MKDVSSTPYAAVFYGNNYVLDIPIPANEDHANATPNAIPHILNEVPADEAAPNVVPPNANEVPVEEATQLNPIVTQAVMNEVRSLEAE